MKLIPRRSRRTRLKRSIAVLSVAIGFVLLVVQAFFVRWPRYDVIAPFLAVTCGVDYLRATRGRS